MDDTSKSIREAFVEASSFLKRHGVDEAALNGELLLQHLLGWSRTKLLLNWQDPLPSDLELDWQKLLSRRAAGEPVQYIIGQEGFYGLMLRVTPAVLIPRPETEILVQELMHRGLRLWPAEAGEAPLMADIGTGSGAIPITVAVYCPSWKLAAVDLSAEALQIAEDNAQKHSVGDRISFYQGDLYEPLIRHGMAPDIIVSNPPYIPSRELPDLQREVRDFEPHLALDGGDDGLDFYHRLVAGFKELPKPPRLAGFEVGMGQAQAVAEMLKESGLFTTVDIVRDLSGIERHVLAERS
jgi:release factor glutamine methyltransferase